MSGRLIAIVLASWLAACEHGKGGGVFDGGDDTDAGGSGLQCGGFAGTPCPAGEFCDFAANNCGGSDETGVCVTKPVSCNTLLDPVCACDGQVHGNACSAAAAGFDLDASGFCKVEPGTFTCGFEICNLDTQYCERVNSDIGEEPPSFECKPIPSSCGIGIDCACFAGEPCGSECSGDRTSGFTLVCLGG